MFPQILACDISGNPHDWISWEQAITQKVKGNISFEIGDPDVLVRGGISRMTGKQSSIEVSSIICLKGNFKRSDRVALTNQNLFRRDLHICGYCGRTFREDKLTRDHIIPRSRGGKDVWNNVITACKSCNGYKGSYFLEELSNMPDKEPMELLYVPYAPNRSEALVLENRRILTDQMEFLKNFLPEHSRLHGIRIS